MPKHYTDFPLEGIHYRIEDHGYTTPCWVWLRARDNNGYGVIGRNGKLTRGHRLMCEIAHGPIPPGFVADHLCCNTWCINPDHIEPVSFATNVRRGPAAKLTIEIARQIRAASGTYESIGRRFGIHTSVVARIKTGERWREDQ